MDSKVDTIPVKKKRRRKKEFGRESPRLLQSPPEYSAKLMESPWAKIACRKGLMSQGNSPAFVAHRAPSCAESGQRDLGPQSGGSQQLASSVNLVPRSRGIE